MNKSIAASLIGLTFTLPAHAEEVTELSNTVVTAGRINQTKQSTLSDVTVINRETIERAGAGSITDLLQAQPGVQINTSGGAGNTSSVFLRGTNSDHVVVLIDGLRVNSATLGTTSFENIPLSQIEKIEILRAPASSLYGADAIGGVIQIFTKKGTGEKPLVHAAVGVGSFDTKKAEAGISGGVGNTKYSLNVSSLDTGGISAQKILSKTTPIDKDDDGYTNLGLSAMVNHTFVPGHAVGLQYFASKGVSHFDGNNYENFGRQTLQSYAITSENQLTDNWQSVLKLGKGIDDSDSHNQFGDSRFKTEQTQYTWQNNLSLPVGTLTLAYDRLAQKVNGSTDYAKDARNNNGYLAGYIADIGSHSVQASLREDRNSQFGNHATGGVGYGYRISPEWRVSANYGTAFKAPTFNQLYYPFFGDPKLKPEKSENVEASVKYANQTVQAGITVFNNNIRNLIEFSGAASAGCAYAGFCPVNVGKATIKGVTLDANWLINSDFTLSGNLTAQSPHNEDADQMLVRRGNLYGAIMLAHSVGNFQWGTEVTGASTRYNNASNTKKMGGYALLNLTASYRITPEWKLETRANNVLNKDYTLSYTGNSPTSNPYNTAGANAFIGLRYQMKP